MELIEELISKDQSEMPEWLRGSEMGELIFIHDWTESGLGPIDAWPPHLQLVVNIILLLPSAAILLWGPNLIQIYNDRFRDLMSGKHPKGLGQMVSECWSEAWSFVGPATEAVTQRGESLTFDEQRLVLNRDGSPEESFFRLTYSPVPGGMPNATLPKTVMPGGVLVTVIETTEVVHARAREAERIQLKEALQANRIQLLEEVFRTAPSFLHVLRGPDFVFEFANDAYYQLVGRRELIGRPAFEAISEAAECGYQDRLLQVMATGKPFMGFDLPVTLARIPGQPPEQRFIDLAYLSLFDEDGTCQRVLGHGIDVTAHVQERKQAEDALRQSEERFRQALEIDTVGVIFFNRQGEIVEANDAFLKMSGFSRVGRRTGLLRWHVGVSVDITDAVSAETALLEADRRKDEFLATLAHELRNPLAPISNALALMARPGGSQAVSHLLPVISRQVNYMVRLVDDLLEISRITSGKVELRRAATDLTAVLRNAVDASRPLINENTHKLSISIPEATLIVYGDSVRLEQVFTNLLNNAARYTRKGGQIWLTARQEGEDAVVSVRDNGIGILPGMLPRLFDMFAQERRDGVGTQEGLGIGLSLVYRLVKMHGGTVEAMSEGKDRGSEFVVRLPLSEAPAHKKNDEPEKTAPTAPEALRVLVVDDNHDAAEVLQMLLESIGVNAQAVNSGPAALATIPDFRPNIILMDIGMPGMSGHEVARRIREQPQFNNIKLVALTGWGQDEDRRDSKASGFDHHLTKPVNFKVLKDLLAAV